jgi:hypothetical protein
MTTPRYGLPEIAASQSQKHVTHNQAINGFDALVNAVALDKDLTAPPGSPSEGDGYIVGSSATGAWAGKDLNFVSYNSGAWYFYVPPVGMRVYVSDESLYYRWSGSAWVQEPASAVGTVLRAAETPNGAFMDVYTEEELLSGLSGASVVSTLQIPSRAIVLGVSTRTVVAITGATSYDAGDGSTVDRFGGSLSISAGGTNVGVIGPTAIYSPMNITLTANGSNFTGGDVRIATHYLLPGAPTA